MRLYYLLLFLTPSILAAQTWRAALSIYQGVNYAFLRANDQKSMIGYSMGADFVARRHKSLDGVFFEPGLWFAKNTLRARASEHLHVNMNQQALGLTVKGGLLISKKAYVKVGVLTELVGYSMVETVTETGVSLGHSGFSENLNERHFMSGMTFGIGGVPGESRIVELFFECHQYLTSPFLEPFKLNALGPSQPPVLNSRALSTVFLAGITFKFVKPRKRIEG